MIAATKSLPFGVAMSVVLSFLLRESSAANEITRIKQFAILNFHVYWSLPLFLLGLGLALAMRTLMPD